MSPPDPFARFGGPPRPPAVLDQLIEWVRAEGTWWASSFVFHMLLMCTLMLGHSAVSGGTGEEGPTWESAQAAAPAAPPVVDRFELDNEAPGLDPANLDLSRAMFDGPPGPTIEETEEKYYDDNPIFTERGGGRPITASGPSLGGLGGFDIVAIGPGVASRGPGGVGTGVGTGTNPGSGGSGVGFGGRGTGMKKAMSGGYGGTKRGERAVAAGLDWLARHQFDDGHWGVDHRPRCRDGTCTGEGHHPDPPIAMTALGVLPFLGAGETHMTKGRYQNVVRKGLAYLMKNQRENGDLTGGAGTASMMYHQGLGALALSEAYGMTKDAELRRRAQLALDFIQSAQHSEGGWRYVPGQPGDTSVTGWQIMALKSGQMGGLSVSSTVLDNAAKFLKKMSKGNYGGMFTYTENGSPTPAMTSVGLLCSQYLGVQRTDPLMAEGVAYMMANPPEARTRVLYYWYYATQVLHNVPGPEWDQWNRKMRRALIETQTWQGCALGSWDPNAPPEPHITTAGRMMVTSLAVLTLEVYYRYLPLYKLDAGAAGAAVIQPNIVPPPGGMRMMPPQMRPGMPGPGPAPAPNR